MLSKVSIEGRTRVVMDDVALEAKVGRDGIECVEGVLVDILVVVVIRISGSINVADGIGIVIAAIEWKDANDRWRTKLATRRR